ncbi:heterokaryon incompatibility protein-domain-containing protein, partial [Colletotrichum godetiae]
MRLLNVETRKLREFVISVPEYAILSHTWGDDEVTFQDLDCPDHTKKRGYTKIDGFCCLAAKNGFEWVWVDTCCIDKTSSAELSEAINSMYRWYKDSQICYAYLEDIQPDDDLNGFDRQFGNSRWFTRGWTLQELLAPPAVSFFNAAWKELGTRSSLAREIGSITSIPTDFLRDRHVHRAKVAERMSWAARRQTTRVEDRAYSLLGIFDVNMPLLYGEAEKAFERLQIEVMRQSSDDSILAWSLTHELQSLKSLDDPNISNASTIPALASSPGDFVGWVDTQTEGFYERTSSIMEMTNRGLRVALPV